MPWTGHLGLVISGHPQLGSLPAEAAHVRGKNRTNLGSTPGNDRRAYVPWCTARYAVFCLGRCWRTTVPNTRGRSCYRSLPWESGPSSGPHRNTPKPVLPTLDGLSGKKKQQQVLNVLSMILFYLVSQTHKLQGVSQEERSVNGCTAHFWFSSQF